MDDSYGTKAVKSLLVKGVEHSSTSTLVLQVRWLSLKE